MTVEMSTKATRREWIGLAVIALPCLVYAMDLTVLNLAVPALSAELKPSSSQLLWIIDALQLSALAGAAIVVIACVLSARLLRGGLGDASKPTIQATKEMT